MTMAYPSDSPPIHDQWPMSKFEVTALFLYTDTLIRLTIAIANTVANYLLNNAILELGIMRFHPRDPHTCIKKRLYKKYVAHRQLLL